MFCNILLLVISIVSCVICVPSSVEIIDQEQDTTAIYSTLMNMASNGRSLDLNASAQLLEVERHTMAEVQGAIKYVNGLSNSNLWKFLTEGVSAFKSCFAEDEHVDPVLGVFKLDAHIYCNGTGRDKRRITCCAPQTTEEIQMKFLYYHPRSRHRDEEIKFSDKSLARKFNSSEKIVIIAHGFLESMRISPWMNGTRDGWLDRGFEVIVIEWSHGNQISYWQSAANVRTVGMALGYSIYHWKIWDRVLIVGFSMGGQIVGEAGKYLKARGKMIKECHALDPAGPYFDGGSNEVNLDRSDCEVVQVIHTSASHSPETAIAEFSTLRIGTSKKVGHCDYWINCGHYQLGKCPVPNYVEMYEAFRNSTKSGDDGPLFTNLQSQLTCSHIRGGMVYISALKRKCNYTSYVCVNCGQDQPDDVCVSDQSKGSNTLPPDSICTKDMNVDYLLHTEKDGNYCNDGRNY